MWRHHPIYLNRDGGELRILCELCTNRIDVGEEYYDGGYEHRAHVGCATSLTDFDPRKNIRKQASDVYAVNLYYRITELEDENERQAAVVEAASRCYGKLKQKELITKEEGLKFRERFLAFIEALSNFE